MVPRPGEFGCWVANVAGDGGEHVWDGLTFCACSQNSRRGPWGSPGHVEDLQLLSEICWDQPISASLFLLSPCWHFLAGKNSLAKCLTSSNSLITIS